MTHIITHDGRHAVIPFLMWLRFSLQWFLCPPCLCCATFSTQLLQLLLSSWAWGILGTSAKKTYQCLVWQRGLQTVQTSNAWKRKVHKRLVKGFLCVDQYFTCTCFHMSPCLEFHNCLGQILHKMQDWQISRNSFLRHLLNSIISELLR